MDVGVITPVTGPINRPASISVWIYDVTGVGLVKADGILLLADLVKHSEYLKPILKPSVILLTKYSASLESGCVTSKDDHAWALRGEIIDLPSHGSGVWHSGQHESNASK